MYIFNKEVILNPGEASSTLNKIARARNTTIEALAPETSEIFKALRNGTSADTVVKNFSSPSTNAVAANTAAKLEHTILSESEQLIVDFAIQLEKNPTAIEDFAKLKVGLREIGSKATTAADPVMREFMVFAKLDPNKAADLVTAKSMLQKGDDLAHLFCLKCLKNSNGTFYTGIINSLSAAYSSVRNGIAKNSPTFLAKNLSEAKTVLGNVATRILPVGTKIPGAKIAVLALCLVVPNLIGAEAIENDKNTLFDETKPPEERAEAFTRLMKLADQTGLLSFFPDDMKIQSGALMFPGMRP
jgi:hypothetical protein